MAKKYLSLEGLAEYDSLIKAKIDTVAEAKADWNQNDENALDYVKNRTHWVEQATEVVVEETTETEWSCYLGFNGFGTTEGNFDITATYIITVDGVKYQCEPYTSASGDYMLGDSRLITAFDENGEEVIDNTHPEDVPFSIMCWIDDGGDPYAFGYTEYWYFTYPDSEPHTIKIEKLTGGTIYHTLDEKFIPDTIARVDDITPISNETIDAICNATIYSSSEVEL